MIEVSWMYWKQYLTQHILKRHMLHIYHAYIGQPAGTRRGHIPPSPNARINKPEMAHGAADGIMPGWILWIYASQKFRQPSIFWSTCSLAFVPRKTISSWRDIRTRRGCVTRRICVTWFRRIKAARQKVSLDFVSLWKTKKINIEIYMRYINFIVSYGIYIIFIAHCWKWDVLYFVHSHYGSPKSRPLFHIPVFSHESHDHQYPHSSHELMFVFFRSTDSFDQL